MGQLVSGYLDFAERQAEREQAMYIKLQDYIAKEHNDDSNKILMLNQSKYSYPVLEIQRNKGIKVFSRSHSKGN